MSEPTTTIPNYGHGFGNTGSATDTKPTRRALAWNGGTDLGLLLLRFAIGGIFFAHGMQKIFGMWGYPGIGEFTASVTAAGYQQASVLAYACGVAEIVGGAFLVLGIATPLAGSALLAVKINTVLLKTVGIATIAGVAQAGAVIEYDLVLGLGAAALVLTGPGRIALDNGRAWHRRPASWGLLALVIGVAVGVLVYLFLR
jgi:putative oxidoreductase